MLDACEEAYHTPEKPTVIMENTIKGKGILFAEGKSAFHNFSLIKEQYDIVLSEVGDSCIVEKLIDTIFKKGMLTIPVLQVYILMLAVLQVNINRN